MVASHLCGSTASGCERRNILEMCHQVSLSAMPNVMIMLASGCLSVTSHQNDDADRIPYTRMLFQRFCNIYPRCTRIEVTYPRPMETARLRLVSSRHYRRHDLQVLSIQTAGSLSWLFMRDQTSIGNDANSGKEYRLSRKDLIISSRFRHDVVHLHFLYGAVKHIPIANEPDTLLISSQ